jgi:alkanesulfonate monooxygenase SsuD/methylene tetrahydromethanopterin reductase-like flavin-dependent oxidoreductase (luciferase family)
VSARVRVGLTLPSFVEDPEIPIAVARAAEAAGLDAVFVFDHLWRGAEPNRRPALECFALLGAVAAETTRVQVGPLVARATLRPPATLANCLRTAQRVSGGRLIAAIGAGDSESRAENEAFGLPFGTMEERVAALHDAVRAASDGDFPVWVGGHAAQVREVVAVADGWNGWGGPPDEFAGDVALVREVAPDATMTWGGLVLTGDDEAAAQAKAVGRALSADVLVGGPAHLAEQLRAFVDRGAEWVILGPIDASNPDNAAPLARVRELLQQG